MCVNFLVIILIPVVYIIYHFLLTQTFSAGVRLQATIATLTSEEIALYRQQLLPTIIAQANRQGAITMQAEDGSWLINGQPSENLLNDDVIRQIMRDNGGDAVYFPRE